MSLVLSRHRFSYLFYIVVFRCLLEFSYVNIISPKYAYMGFDLNFGIINYIISWIVFFVAFLIVKDYAQKVSDYFFAIAFFFLIIPLAVLYGYDVDRSFFPLITVLCSIFIVNLITEVGGVSFKNLPTIKHGFKYVIVISTTFVAFLVVWYFISGVHYNLDLTQVYEYRSKNFELSSGGVLAYTNVWTYKIFNMTLFAIALYFKRYFLVLLVFLVQVYFFAASANKGVLFTPVMILGVWFYLRKTSSLLILPIIFSVLILLTLFTFYVLGDGWASSLFSRRVFFVPAHLTYVYFDFFNLNPNVYWSNSVLSSFLNYPYDISLTRVIGRSLGEENMSANNGFISSGYAHAGLYGVFLYSLIIGIILRFINDVTYKSIPLWFAVALTIIPLKKLLTSSDLLVTMLTHGFIVAIIIILFVRLRRNREV
jgi:hypothetical protein